MRSSRIGALVLLIIAVAAGTSCQYYNRVMARKDLVDGAEAYKGRKFPQAEDLFRKAVARDPKGETVEGRTAQLFLARTLHSEFIGDRGKTSLAEAAIAEYQKVLAIDPKDQGSYKAIASLYENLQRTDDWLKLVTDRANNQNIPPEQRAEALTSLAAKKNSCANDISDTEAVKKTVTKDGKQAFQFVKPADPAEFDTFKQCVADGMRLIDQAVALETPQVKSAASFDIKGATDAQLLATMDVLKVFESARSYKAALTVQAMREAEMENRIPDRDRLKAEADAARASFTQLSDVVKKIQAEIDDRAAAKQAAENPRGAANANSNSSK